MRPVIGITCYVERVDRDPWVGQLSAVLPEDYVRSVAAAGGLPVVLPPAPSTDVLTRLDGLILAGGVDVEAARYGAEPHPGVQAPRPDRDEWELDLVAAAGDLPLLGICRGMQVLAVAAGGHLEQHLPDVVGHTDHSPAPGVYGRHEVTAAPGTRIAGILGTDPLEVPTYHHQGVLDAPGWTFSAYHPDGTPEAMEDPSRPFRIAVQWHPEAGDDLRLFEALVTAAQAGATGISS